MADNKPFLQGIFDPTADDSALLPGQQSTKPAAQMPKQERYEPVEAAEVPAAPAAVPARRAGPTKADVISRATDLGVDPALALSIWQQESSSGRNAGDSSKGARGGFQVMPDTFRAMLGDKDQRDPWNNMEAGLKYIAYGQKTLRTSDPELLAAGYHAGYDRKDLKAGRIPGTNDGHITTAAYARQVAGRAGKVVSDSPDDMSRYEPLTEADAQKFQQSGTLDDRYVPLSDDEAVELKLIPPPGVQTVPNPLQPAKAPEARGFVDEYITDPLKRGWNSLKQSMTATGTMASARQLEVMGRIDRGEKVPDQDDVVGYQYMTPEQRAEYKATFAKAMNNGVQDIASLGKKIQSIPQDPNVAAAQQAKSFDEWWTHFKKAPFKFIANTGVESLPQMAPGLVLGAGAGVAANVGLKAGGAVAGAAGMGAGSYAVDYPATVLSVLAEKGVNTNDPDALTKAFSDPKLMEDVRKQAHAHASVVGAADALSGGVAGKTLVAGKTAARRAANLGAQTVTQGAMGAGGEAGGQLAQGKDELEWGGIMGEFAGEFAGAPIEVAGAAKLQAQEAAAARDAGATPAADPAATTPPAAAPATPAERIEPTLGQPPAPPAGPLSGAVEAAADHGAQQRVTVTAPTGEQAAGTVQAMQSDEDGNFVTQIMGDDGQVYTFSSEDGVVIAPAEAPAPGPLTAAVEAAAEQGVAAAPAEAPAAEPAPAEPAPAPVAPAQAELDLPGAEPVAAPAVEPAKPKKAPKVEEVAPPPAPQPIEQQLAQMDEPALRERLKYIATQAKASGGWNPMFMKARKAVEKEIAKRQAGTPPVVTQPVKENTDGTRPDADALRVPDDGPASTEAAAQVQPGQPAGREAVQEPDAGVQAAADQPGAGAGTDIPDADAAADAKPALTGNPLQDNPASWIIRNRATGEAMLETFNRKEVDALNTEKYEAVPAYQHLAEVNDPASAAGKAARATSEPAPAAKVKAKAPAKKPSKKATAERQRQLADHFTPGNVVKGYAGHDRVLEYTPDEDGGFTVKVQHVVREGDQWVVAPGVDGRERTHSTMPNDRELKAGPVERAPAAAETPAEAAAPAEEAPKPKRQPRSKAEPIAAAEKPAPEPKDEPAAEQPAPASTIGDFGEKIHGARKDVWTGFREDMSAALPDDVKEITLAKHFPEPNYDALIEAGVDPKVLAALKAMRDEIPAKPRMPFKAKRWGEQVTILRDFANKLLDGTQSLDELLREMRRAGALSKFAERIEMYAALGYPLFRQAKGYTLEKHHYTMFRGETPPGGITKWELSGEKMRSDYFDTQEQGVEALRTRLESLSGQAPEGSGKAVQLDLYRTSGGDIIIGKKVAAGKFIDLKTGFTNVKEARAYLADHRDELLALLEKKKDVRPERRTVNAPRVGEDRRLGDDIAPEQFGETFGFRGVQFGNYVEQKRRAADLNNAYDALLDMAEIIGVPAKAISLNGTLGLAFGARGKGGKNPAAAHYEPGHVVINLTKTNGAGSLGHEWWHGLDNYFAKMRGQGGDFITMSPKPRMVPNAERKMVPDESVRPEALAAFKGVVDAIRDSGMVKRSRELDGRRTKDYWSTIEELTARAFESYLIDKAAEKGHSNDYLANIVSEDAHNAMNGLTGLEEPFPYPTRAEAPAINAAFDRLFETLETKEEDGKVALYSVQDGVTQAEFGPVHTEYRNDPAGAVERLLADKDGEAIVDVPGLGDVSLIYGDEKTGLGHIARRRGDEFMERLPALLKDGTLYSKPGQKDRVFLGNDRDEAVVRFEWDGQAKTWLLSAYEKYPDGVKLAGPVQQQSRRSETVAERTDDWLDTGRLRRALRQGPVGAVIDSMIEAGVVVLHGGPSTLPKELGKKVKGVQAVTMPDGTIHMVASNLNERNARAVMLHEAFHQGGQKLIGTQQWSEMMGRLGSLYRQSEQSSGKAREFFDRARERVAAAKKKGAVATRMEVEEFAAYAIEEYETSRDSLPAAIRKWVEDIIGMVKAWAVKRYGKQIGAITPAQLAAFAKLALMDVAVARRGEIFGPLGELFSATGQTIEVNGKRRPVEDSNDRLVAEDMNKQLAFYRWFGDSKVVDEQGRPLVVYHGTGKDFGRFDTRRNDLGSHFGTIDQANQAAAGKKTGAVLPVYLNIENPLRIVDRGDFNADTIAQQLEEAGIITKAQADELFNAAYDEDAKPRDLIRRAQRHIEKAGYDGVVYLNRQEGLDADHTSTTISDDEFRAKHPAARDSWIAFRPEQIKSAIGNTGTFDQDNADIRFSVTDDTRTTTTALPPEPPSYTPPEQGMLRRIQGTLQDNQNRVKQVQEQILKITGRTSLGKSDYYGAETNRPGRIAARLEDARDKLTGPLMERLAKSGYTPAQLSELLHAQHAKERNEAVAKINPDMPDGGSGMTNVQADAILENYAAATELHEMAKQARAIAKATLDLKLAYGLIKAEDHELLSSMYENYVPLKGDGEYGPKIKRAMGHEQREEHILENIARDYDQAVVVGEKNLARQSLLRMIMQFPDEDLWTARVPPRGRYVAGRSFSVERNGKSEAVFTSQAQVAAFLEAKGAEALQYQVLDSAGERVVEFVRPLQDNEVLVYVNGDPVRLQIHDEVLARQLRPLDQAKMGPILEFMRSINRWLSKVYTGYNPAFILRNTARDAMTGTINMLGNQGVAVTAKAWSKYPKALVTLGVWAKTKKAPDTKMGRYLTEYRMHGGKVGASYMSDLEQQGATLQEMYDNARGLAATARERNVKRTSAVAWNKTVGRLAHVIEIANQATENALRLSLFIALREEGLSPGKAAQAAKGVTVDFDRKGTQTGMLGAIYLFFNPAIQGVSNGFKTLAKGEHREQAWAALGTLALAGAWAASAGMGDDKDRWLGEEWDNRTKNFIFNVGDRQIKIPLSQEFAPAYALGVAITEAMHGEDKFKTAVKVVSSFIDAYFPLQGIFKPESDRPVADIAQAVTPTVFKPVVETALNRNSFGSQIVPETELTKDRPDNMKMFRGTKGTAYDAAAQGIASFGEMMGAGRYENDITKVSPETLKSLWRTYTGGLGTFITDSIGVGAMTVTAPGEVELTETPIVKDFVKTKDVKAIRGRYYDLSRNAKTAITEFELAKKAGDGEALDKILSDADKAKMVGLGRMVRKINEAAAAMGDEKVSINSQDDLSVVEKRARLKEIEKEEEALYRDAISAFK